MNYYIDTEFLEGTQKYGQPWFNFWLGPKPKTKPTIDLISIGIVAEDGREYYAISKDFNLREAWNRWQIKEVKCSPGKWDNNEDALIRKDSNTLYKKDYWIRENVLRPIVYDLWDMWEIEYEGEISQKSIGRLDYQSFKSLINKYGKTNQQIAQEVKDFCLDNVQVYKSPDGNYVGGVDPYKGKPVFYGYFADYDWVAFCWLFGKMNNLPNGFPKYSRDLKQMLDEKVSVYEDRFMNGNEDFETRMSYVMNKDNYPKQTNEHNALADARWNKELHEFIQSL